MNRDYINWLETLPCNRKPQKVNVWMGGWAPLPEEIDLPAYEDWQDRENQRNPKGVMSRLWRWGNSHQVTVHAESLLSHSADLLITSLARKKSLDPKRVFEKWCAEPLCSEHRINENTSIRGSCSRIFDYG